MSRGPYVTADDLRACAEAGLTLKETATRCGVTYSAVVQRGRRLRLQFRSALDRPTLRSEPILTAIRAGARTAPEIAKHIDCPQGLVTNTLQRFAAKQLIYRVGRGKPTNGRPPIVWRAYDEPASSVRL